MPSASTDPQGPLAGYRILDMTTVLLGPYATQILGDLGAEIIKVESPDGDLMRQPGRPRHPGMGPVHLTVNRNKRSLVLDLKKEGAKVVARRLIAGVDALITNVRPQGMERLGLDYERVKALNPEIVYVHAVGYASGGPYSGRQAYDDLIQAASGIADLLPKTERHSTPRFLPSLMADKTTGLHVVYATLAALLHRERGGGGQFVEVPMLESMVFFNLAEHLYGHVFLPPRGSWGYTRVLTPTRRPFKTKDGYLAIMPYTDAHWPLFFDLVGRPELWHRWRHATFEDRTRHIEELYDTIGELTEDRTTAEWMEDLNEANIPCMRINRLEDLPEDPHLVATDFFEIREHPTEGPYRSMRHPVRFSESPAGVRSDPPRLGEDSREILTDLGLGEAEIDALVAEGAVGVADD